MNGSSRTRILMAGPVSPPVGGASLLFERLADALSARPEFDPRIIDTSNVRGRGANTARSFAALLRRLRRDLKECDVAALHVATSGLHVMGPLMVSLARRADVPLIIRKFGGTDFTRFDPVRKLLILKALRSCDLYLAETRELIGRAAAVGVAPAEWFPNCRPMPALPEVSLHESRKCRRFVYLGQLRQAKGIRELVQVGEELGERATVDIYGIPGYDLDVSYFDGLRFVRYLGPLEPPDVPDTLSRYDALVLPSYMEGYPGVIIEAYAAGLPVIATCLSSISEIVDDSCGILVEPRDTKDLSHAMQCLIDSPEEYARLRRGVHKRRTVFDETRWHERFAELCKGLARKRGPGGLA